MNTAVPGTRVGGLAAIAATKSSSGNARAVSRSAGEPYRDRLLSLPAFLLGPGAASLDEVLAGLELTGHFLARDVFSHGPHPNVGEPASRSRLVQRLRRQGA